AASGYYVLRDGWTRDANYMLVDGGPHGAHEINCGHAHADALAFDLAARGRTLLVDPGTYTYTGAGAWRDHFRRTQAHHTLTTDDGCVREVNRERSGLELHVCTQTGGAWHAAEDWVSPAYGARVPAPLYKFSVTAAGAQEFITALVPLAASEMSARTLHELGAVGGRAFSLRASAAQ